MLTLSFPVFPLPVRESPLIAKTVHRTVSCRSQCLCLFFLFRSGSLFSLTKRATGTFLPVSTPVVNTFSVYCVGCVAAGAPAEGSLLSLRQQSTGLLSAEASAFRRCLRNSFRLPRYQKEMHPKRVHFFLVEARGVEHLQDINRKIKVICLQK